MITSNLDNFSRLHRQPIAGLWDILSPSFGECHHPQSSGPCTEHTRTQELDPNITPKTFVVSRLSSYSSVHMKVIIFYCRNLVLRLSDALWFRFKWSCQPNLGGSTLPMKISFSFDLLCTIERFQIILI